MEVSDYSVLRPLYPRDKKIRCPLNKTLVGAADEAWAFMENKKKMVCTYRDSNLGQSNS